MILKGTSPLVEEAAQHVFDTFRDQLPADLVFHDFHHTYETAKAAKRLAKGMELSEEDTELVMLSAFMHDMGYIKTYEGHEQESVKMAREFLQSRDYPEDRIKIIEACILSTSMPQSPKTPLEEIVCDADLSNLAQPNQEERGELLRAEWENRGIRKMSDDEWLEEEFQFLSQHRYHTTWASINWGPDKKANVLRLRKSINRRKEKDQELEKKLEVKKKDFKLKQTKAKLPDRGIETMFRTASRTHINLSAIADNKANIMLSINALIISVIISGLASKLDSNPTLLMPTMILLAVCIISIIFATLSTRPKITKGKFTKEDIEQRRTNLLFFGNFFNMELKDYMWGMNEMMKDKDFLYGSLTRDLYFLGVVLAKKYRFLNITYTVFMWGLIISVLAFAITFIFNPGSGGVTP
jgi:putative nucleotidyltransferase with HDIG domain